MKAAGPQPAPVPAKTMLDDTSDGRDRDHGDTDDAASDAPRTARKVRSEIAFPYAGMEDALTIVRTISEAGGDLTRDQAIAMLSLPSSTFNVRVATARMMGLIRAEGGDFRITQDGKRIVSADSDEALTARCDAFMNVILYRKTYEAYKGTNLPDQDGLETFFKKSGVSPKQADKARLAFERSAAFAGFFHAGKTRLVKPLVTNSHQERLKNRTDEAALTSSGKETFAQMPPHPAAHQHLIVGLLERLPAPDTAWPIEDRARWLRALAVNLGMLYGADDDGEITIVAPARQVVERPKAQRPQSTTPPPPSPEALAKAGSTGWEPAESDLDEEIPF